MLILCDFDGTATALDSNVFLSERFAPNIFLEVERKLLEGEMTLRQVLTAELGAMTDGHDAIVKAAVEGIPMRAGFDRFVRESQARGDRFVLLSAGFRQVIEPMLAGWGIESGLPLIANDVSFDERGGRITWREQPVCVLCGEQCKRSEVDELRAEEPGRSVIYIGDGFSDRCGAEAADRIFARDNLAAYLDAGGTPYTWFDDFHEIAEVLA